MERLEEAAAFYRQAVDRSAGDIAGEGRRRNNLADTLCQLGRLDEARQEIERAIVCGQGLGHAAGLWKTWAILSDIETDTGKLPEAQQARQQAIKAYLAYRRDGGESLVQDGKLCDATYQMVRTGQAGDAEVSLHHRSRSSVADRTPGVTANVTHGCRGAGSWAIHGLTAREVAVPFAGGNLCRFPRQPRLTSTAGTAHPPRTVRS